jgi:transposase
VEQGFRWIKNPAAIQPVWLEKPERIAALAMLTVVGLLVYGLIQRQVRHDLVATIPLHDAIDRESYRGYR